MPSHQHITLPLAVLAGSLSALAAQPSSSNQYQNTPGSVPQNNDSNWSRRGDNSRTGAWLNDRAGQAGTLRRWSDLKELNVYTPTGDDLGEITNLVVDRGSGKVTHAVVDTAASLNTNSDEVIISYDELRYDPVANRFQLPSGAVVLYNAPVYSEDEWDRMRDSSPADGSGWNSRHRNDGSSMDNQRRGNRNTTDNIGNTGTLGRITQGQRDYPSNNVRSDNNAMGGNRSNQNTGVDRNDQRNQGQSPMTGNTPRNDGTNSARGDNMNQPGGQDMSSRPRFDEWLWKNTQPGGDPYSVDWGSATPTRIEGEIKRVTRTEVAGAGEQVVVEIGAPDGTSTRVLLGPSWYIAGSDVQLSRGDRISVQAMPLQVAQSAVVNGRSLTLRDTQNQGGAAWNSPQYKHGDSTYSAPYAQRVRITTLTNARLDCRGTECGNVDDLILDVTNGRVVFLSIDPNENFLGINDTKRLVPWTLTAVGMNNTIRIDASKEMIVASMETPRDLTTLEQQAGQGAFTPFQLDEPRR